MHLGLEMLDALEKIHKSGYVYNDIKPENILIGKKDVVWNQELRANCFENTTFHLIDMGFATRWRDKKTGKHLKQKDVDFFRGNPTFCSLNQLLFYSTSRKDDLISLMYLLIYFLRKGNLPEINEKEHKEINFSNLEKMTKIKTRFTAKYLTHKIKETVRLRPLVSSILRLEYDETPDYNAYR